MNLCLKLLLTITAIIIISCSAWFSDSALQSSAKKKNQCQNATYGRLYRDGLKLNDLGHNAFLLNCSLLPIVPEPDEKRAEYNKCMKDKQNLASKLLIKNFDVNYYRFRR